MPEIFSISGAEMGQAAACPAGWARTPKGNCGAPVAGCPPSMRYGNGACRSQQAIALQNVLVAFGKQLGDRTLSGVDIDGFIGAGTAAATNKALRSYTLRAAQRYRTGTLSTAQIANEIGTITSILVAEVASRGIKVPEAPVFRAAALRPSKAEGAPSTALVPGTGPSRATAAILGIGALAAVGGLVWWFMRKDRGSYEYAGASDELGGSLSKQDYIAFAKILCRHTAPEGLTQDLANYFEGDNPKFAKSRFIDATRKC